jgi:hypothetical protein
MEIDDGDTSHISLQIIKRARYIVDRSRMISLVGGLHEYIEGAFKINGCDT